MNLIFVLLLTSMDGGINTDLKFTTQQGCERALRSFAFVQSNNSAQGRSTAMKYVGGACIQAEGLILERAK